MNSNRSQLETASVERDLSTAVRNLSSDGPELQPISFKSKTSGLPIAIARCYEKIIFCVHDRKPGRIELIGRPSWPSIKKAWESPRLPSEQVF